MKCKACLRLSVTLSLEKPLAFRYVRPNEIPRKMLNAVAPGAGTPLEEIDRPQQRFHPHVRGIHQALQETCDRD